MGTPNLSYRNWSPLLAAIEKQPVGLGSPQLVELLRQMLEQSRLHAVAITGTPAPVFKVNGFVIPQPPNLVDSADVKWQDTKNNVSALIALAQSILTVNTEASLTGSRKLTAGIAMQSTDNGAGSTFVLDANPAYIFDNYKMARLETNGTNTARTGAGSIPIWGDILDSLSNPSGGGIALVGASATETEMFRMSGTPGVPIDGYQGGPLWNFGTDFDIKFRLRLNQLTTERFWFAMTDSTGATIMASDTNTGHNIAGFRFSTVAGDTTFQSYTRAGSATAGNREINDTLIAPDTTNSQFFQISYRASTGFVTFYINNVQVTQHTTFIPAAGTMMRFVAGLQEQGFVATVTFDTAFGTVLQRRPIP